MAVCRASVAWFLYPTRDCCLFARAVATGQCARHAALPRGAYFVPVSAYTVCMKRQYVCVHAQCCTMHVPFSTFRETVFPRRSGRGRGDTALGGGKFRVRVSCHACCLSFLGIRANFNLDSHRDSYCNWRGSGTVVSSRRAVRVAQGHKHEA